MNILFKIQFWIAIIIVTVVVASCSDVGKPPITPEWDRSGEAMVVTVFTYDTEKQMNQAIEYRLGKQLEQSVKGYAIMSPDDNICEVFTLAPKRVDDDRTMTIGHEVLHCLYGRYHKDN